MDIMFFANYLIMNLVIMKVMTGVDILMHSIMLART